MTPVATGGVIALNTQKGFTLIELIAVMVILGILGAVAVPKFISMSSEAEVAAMAGVVGAAESASAINFAGCSANDPDCVNIAAGADCSTVLSTSGIMQSAPTGYTPSGTAPVGAVAGDVFVCSIAPPAGQTVAAGSANIIVTQ
jgi:prepilin-type N-terminal cleavage/methylation domain-containing protein